MMLSIGDGMAAIGICIAVLGLVMKFMPARAVNPEVCDLRHQTINAKLEEISDKLDIVYAIKRELDLLKADHDRMVGQCARVSHV